MKRNIKGKLFNYTLIDLITLHQLRIFELAAITGSFTQAAKELNLKQPTVSAQIKQLEGTIGLPLFERLGKRLYLTDAGRALQSACHEILTQIDQTEQHLSECRETIQGTLHLAATTTAKYFLPEGIQQFHKQYPEVYISLTVNNHDVVIDRLNNNIDDLYIFSRLPDRDDLVVQAFLANPLVVIAPINHWLSQAPMPIPLSIVAAELMIMRERGSATREASESFLHSRNS
jgi:LysR family transcriptional regulator, low CO2-responsive transcriptional regulator